MTRIAALFALVLASCTDDPQVDSSQYAIDVDHSGAFDCADLDQVHACIGQHIAGACALADVNHDGVIDTLDVQDISTALHDAGHVCAPH
jgi:hypothetical protein